MAMGRSRARQEEMFIHPADLPKGDGHLFYEKLNQFLAKNDFDRQVEAICQPYYDDGSQGGRPSLPPGVYFRMNFIGYFEGIASYRGIAFRCSDSLSLRKFLDIPLTESTPDHSTLSYLRQRFPQVVHDQVMGLLLGIAKKELLLRGESLIVDSTLIEANAAMASIEHKKTNETYQEYLKNLAAEDGLPNAKANELRNYDKKRPGKSCSNKDWQSPSDPEAKITKMKDGTTHLAYKVEHAVDAGSGMIVSSQVYTGIEHDTATLEKTLMDAQINLVRSGSDTEVSEVVADKGYHAAATLEACETLDIRTYISEKKLPKGKKHQWMEKGIEAEERHRDNHRRVKSEKGQRLMRKRGELVERSFAHTCETGGGRRIFLRGTERVQKRHSLLAMAFNLGVMMRNLFQVGTPRSLQGRVAAVFVVVFAAIVNIFRWIWFWREAEHRSGNFETEKRLPNLKLVIA